MNAKILIAEDDPNIRLGLVATLESEGYAVTAAADGAQALKLFPQETFALVIRDVMMPRASGYDVCRELRARGARVPVLFLTAKGEEVDKVVGLKLGADDYVTKPFGVHELLARVEALLRRSRTTAAEGDGAATVLPGVFRLGAAEIDRRKFVATVAGHASDLTARELRLAEVFAAHPGEVLTRDALLNAVWGGGLLRHDAHARPACRATEEKSGGRAGRAAHDHHGARRGLPLRRLNGAIIFARADRKKSSRPRGGT